MRLDCKHSNTEARKPFKCSSDGPGERGASVQLSWGPTSSFDFSWCTLLFHHGLWASTCQQVQRSELPHEPASLSSLGCAQNPQPPPPDRYWHVALTHREKHSSSQSQHMAGRGMCTDPCHTWWQKCCGSLVQVPSPRDNASPHFRVAPQQAGRQAGFSCSFKFWGQAIQIHFWGHSTKLGLC